MDAAEFERTLEDCETRLDRLRALYEQYFQGMERLEPMIPKKALQRNIQVLRRNIPRNTAMRFRFQQLLQKHTTYLTYWRRISRQIEEGTYRRDVMKARRKREDARARQRSTGEKKKSATEGYSLDVDVDTMDVEAEVAAASAEASAAAQRIFASDDVLAALDRLGPRSLPPEGGPRPSLSPFSLPSKRPGPPARPTNGGEPSSEKRPRTPARPAQKPAIVVRPAPTPAAAKVIGGPDDARMRGVYDRYVEARRRNNERVDNIRFESVKKSIEKQLPKLRQKHKGKKIDFEVVIRNGKVGLKPVPK